MTQQKDISCLVIGGGGHAGVVIDALLAGKGTQRIGVLDSEPGKIGSELLGQPVVGDDAYLPHAFADGYSHMVIALGGIAMREKRRVLFDEAVAAGLTGMPVVHPSAIVSPFAEVGAGAVVMAGAVVNPRASLGANVIVNTGAVVEHDCTIGAHAQLATGVCLAGGVQVGAGAHIGVGAIVLPGVEIGADAVVGAGAVVTKPVAPGVRVLGVPAKEG